MLAKPDACIPCPFYGDGLGIVYDEIVPDAEVFIMGQGPGATEEREGKPFIGPTGQTQEEKFLPLAGLDRGRNVSIGNLLKCRWTNPDGKKTDLLPSGEVYEQAVEHCTREHLRIPDGTKVIVAEGAHAASWCAGRPVKVWQWRGHVLWPSKPELPTVYVVEHLAGVARDPKMWWVSELDWRKIPRIVSGTWPRKIPDRIIATTYNWGEVTQWFTDAKRSAPYIVIDTEFLGRPFGGPVPMLTIIGIGYLDSAGRVRGVQIDLRCAENWMRASFFHHLDELVRLCPVVNQNFAADMPVLKQCAGIQYEQYKRNDDTMLRHAVMYCELPHGLEFLASIYGVFFKLKHLGDAKLPVGDAIAWVQWLVDKGHTVLHHDGPITRQDVESLYNWGDVLETISAEEHLVKALDTDHLARDIYENQSRRLIPILLDSMEQGIRVNKERVETAKVEYEARCKEAQAVAELYYGKPINLGSDDQIAYYCYCEKGYEVQYNMETKRPTVDEDAIAFLRDIVGPTVDPRVPLTLDLVLQRVNDGADPILESRVLYGEAAHTLSSYIYPMYDGNGKVRDRIYPDFAIHPQKNARWSTTGIPLAQLPPGLRNPEIPHSFIIIPDEGRCWPHWDWKSIELHLLEAHSGSRILKQAHDNGIDIHTWTMCKVFRYDMPPDLTEFNAPANAEWRAKYGLSKGDPRRVFSKSARFEMNYGGTGSNAADKAIRMGLDKKMVQQALANLLTADIDYYRWRQSIEREVKNTRIIRTFMGRPRRFLTVSKDHTTTVPPKVVREALDYPMQAGVSDIFNTTLIAIIAKYPFMRFAWQIHDSIYLDCPVDRLTDEVIQGIKDIATRPFLIEGRTKSVPIDFDVIYPPKENTNDIQTVSR